MSDKIKILTPRIYEHSDFFHNAVDFAREHSLNTNELCLELSHYLVDNFDKVWKIEKPRVYKRVADLEAKLAEKEKQYHDAVANCVNLANTRAILKLHKVQDRIDDMKSKYDCDIEYHLGANNELTHLWEYIDKLIEEMRDGKDV